MKSQFSSAECACHVLALKPKQSFSSQTYILAFLAPRTPVWQFRSQNAALCLPSRRKTLPYGATEKPQIIIFCMPLNCTPIIQRIWARMPCLAQPECRPPERHLESWPQTEHIGPAMALGRHLFQTSVFRLQNLDLISN